MRMYKNDGREHIPRESPIETDLEEVLKTIDKLPTVDERHGNLLGLINNRGERLEVARLSKKEWFLEYRVVEGGRARTLTNKEEPCLDKGEGG